MLTAYLPVLIGLAGLLLYGLSNNGKVQEVGRILFFCGALVECFQLAGHMARIG